MNTDKSNLEYRDIFAEIDRQILIRTEANLRIKELSRLIPAKIDIENRAINKSKKVSVYDIVRESCVYYSIDYADIVSKSKKHYYAERRYVIMAVIKSLCDPGCQKIGRAFNRDHATAIHGVNMFNKLRTQPNYKWMQEDFTNIITKIMLNQ